MSDTIYRKRLLRIYELRDAAQGHPTPIHFVDLADKLAESPIRLKHFCDIEAELEGLSTSAWNDLKTRLLPQLADRDKYRGWRALFDTLNEAKGFNHLVSLGCIDVEFIPRSPKKHQKNPDLKGFLAGATVLCEVKTINISQEEAKRRATGAAGTVYNELSQEFFNKLSADLDTAQQQIAAYDGVNVSRKIVYVVLNYDDNLHEYADNYFRQIEEFLAAKPHPGIEICFHIKPPFYSARG